MATAVPVCRTARKRSAQRRRREGIGTGRSRKKGASSRRTTRRMVVVRSVRSHRLQLLDHAEFDEHARLLVRDRHVEHASEHLAFQVRQTPRPVRLFGASCDQRRTASCYAAGRIRPRRQSHRRTASGVRGTSPNLSPCGAPCSRAGACPAGSRRCRSERRRPGKRVVRGKRAICRS